MTNGATEVISGSAEEHYSKVPFKNTKIKYTSKNATSHHYRGKNRKKN